MSKKDINAQKSNNADIKRYLGILSEDFQDKVQVIAEQFGSLNGKLDEHSQKLDAHTEMFGSINGKLDDHSRKLDEHSQKLDEHSWKLDAHSRKFDEHSQKLDEHSKKFDDHSQKLDAHTEMFGSIMEDLAIIKLDTGFIKDGLKKKVDYEEFQLLKKEF